MFLLKDGLIMKKRFFNSSKNIQSRWIKYGFAKLVVIFYCLQDLSWMSYSFKSYTNFRDKLSRWITKSKILLLLFGQRLLAEQLIKSNFFGETFVVPFFKNSIFCDSFYNLIIKSNYN